MIELLAVVVILAVVMGIAMNSVLSSMNKARGGSLEDSAMVIANTFNQKYTESLVDGVPTDVLGDVLGKGKGYKFQETTRYYLGKKLATTFNISEKDYAFVDSTVAVNANADSTVVVNDALDGTSKVDGVTVYKTTVKNSVVSFNASTGKFVVCLVANPNGSYFVSSYAATGVKKLSVLGVQVDAGVMYACSDGNRSWK